MTGYSKDKMEKELANAMAEEYRKKGISDLGELSRKLALDMYRDDLIAFSEIKSYEARVHEQLLPDVDA